MSNIYIQEPPTSGKVLLKTTVGDIDIELWAKETPKTCRNFVQLCMEGYYNDTIFHRLVKGFIVQGGDPKGDGTGGESIYGHPFKDEFHSRLRFVRRGLVAMANSGKNDNASQFFFTLAATPELQNKHTIFGKVAGDTLYNMLKLEDGMIDEDERPVYPQKILKTEVLINPFDDIVPRIENKIEDKKTNEKKKKKKSGVKDFKLLSFGEEAEEDEQETLEANEKFATKSKSTHDLLNDPKLSSELAVDTKKRKYSDESSESDNEDLKKEQLDKIIQKLSTKSKSKLKEDNQSTLKDEEEYYLGKDREDEKKRKIEEIQKEIKSLKKSVRDEKKSKEEIIEKQQIADKSREKKSQIHNDYMKNMEKYSALKEKLPKKGASREQFTLELLKKFQNKLHTVREKAQDLEDGEDNSDDDTWLAHKLHFGNKDPILAKDANTKDDSWYDIDDPRHPLNKRRRDQNNKK